MKPCICGNVTSKYHCILCQHYYCTMGCAKYYGDNSQCITLWNKHQFKKIEHAQPKATPIYISVPDEANVERVKKYLESIQVETNEENEESNDQEPKTTIVVTVGGDSVYIYDSSDDDERTKILFNNGVDDCPPTLYDCTLEQEQIKQQPKLKKHKTKKPNDTNC